LFLLEVTAGTVPASHSLHERLPTGSTWDTAAPRYDRFAVRYEATVHITAIDIWLRSGDGRRSDPSDNLES
jgi:transposase